MRIGIDARFLTHPQLGGFKTYTENLIAALADIDSENEYVLYLDRPPAVNDWIPRTSNFQSRVVPGSMPLIGLPLREQVALARWVKRDRIDVFHSPCLTAPIFLSCPLVVTVHDMIWASPENFTSSNTWSIKRMLMDWYNYLVPKHAIQQASAIITVSHASKKSIEAFPGLSSDRIVVTHEAAGTAFRKINEPVRLEAVRKKYDLPSCYVLAIGASDPRKNINFLIRAYRVMPEPLKEKYKLVIVWTHPFLAQEISRQVDELDLTQNVQFLKQVPNDDLALLYNAADLFVFPSRFEGFGLPLLEAMACGAPVAAANNSSIPEIAGDAALLFDANDLRDMTDTMINVLTDEGLRSRLVHRGLTRAATFSWNRCARETISVYQYAAR
jgi:glycosyltransferase involved in cell wall biosynthesis